jgi:hypothetical protein
VRSRWSQAYTEAQAHQQGFRELSQEGAAAFCCLKGIRWRSTHVASLPSAQWTQQTLRQNELEQLFE